jgi:hypothetical protein
MLSTGRSGGPRRGPGLRGASGHACFSGPRLRVGSRLCGLKRLGTTSEARRPASFQGQEDAQPSATISAFQEIETWSPDGLRAAILVTDGLEQVELTEPRKAPSGGVPQHHPGADRENRVEGTKGQVRQRIGDSRDNPRRPPAPRPQRGSGWKPWRRTPDRCGMHMRRPAPSPPSRPSPPRSHVRSAPPDRAPALRRSSCPARRRSGRSLSVRQQGQRLGPP